MKNEIWIFGLLLLIVSFFFDPEILNLINSLRFGLLTSIMTYFTYVWVVIGVLVIYFILLKDKKNILLLGASFVLAYVISVIIKLLIMRERPENALMLVDGFSFPSSHASVAFSTVALMNKEFPNLKWIFILIAVLITISRAYLGVHYTSDIIAGGFLGYGVGFLVLNRNAVLTKMKALFKNK
tara:strand:- start:115 stop:663 length:549 start_codon:yes stop_codon:yes gene_type:complete